MSRVAIPRSVSRPLDDSLTADRSGSDASSRKLRSTVPDLTRLGSARADAAPKLSRGERREEKRRAHDAHKKARAIEKENDKREKARDKTEKKNNKNQKKQDKKRR